MNLGKLSNIKLNFKHAFIFGYIFANHLSALKAEKVLVKMGQNLDKPLLLGLTHAKKLGAKALVCTCGLCSYNISRRRCCTTMQMMLMEVEANNSFIRTPTS